MNCLEVGKILDAYLDNELDIIHSTAVEQHLAGCEECRQKAEIRKALIRLVQSGDLMQAPSPGLAARVQNALDGGSAGKSSSVSAIWRPLAIAASFLFVCLLGFHLMTRHGSNGTGALADQIYEDHVRSLLASHLTDVVSSDQHTVKPWFDGKVNFSPPVKDLGDSGFTLLGGRLDVLENQRVAAIVYSRRQHVINLFVWPYLQERDEEIRSESRSGYHLLTWSSSGMGYCAISDLNTDELREFVRMIRE